MPDEPNPIVEPPPFAAARLGTVESVSDPENGGRVQVRMVGADGLADQAAPVWARVVLPFVAGNASAPFVPNVGDEVLTVFLAGDPRFPVVIGRLWDGQDASLETDGEAGDALEQWGLTGKAGRRLAIVEASASGATIRISTPGGLVGTPTANVQITAAGEIDITAPTVKVSAAMTSFSGVVQCDLLQATTVAAATYTPGAGNIW